jgi:hypothetical protein
MKYRGTKYNETDVKKLFEETVEGHDEVRVHIEFAYEHYDEFIAFYRKKFDKFRVIQSSNDKTEV